MSSALHWEYLDQWRFFAQSQRRLEPVVLRELEELGASDCEESYCGVTFTADRETLYKINYRAATVIRVLAPLVRFPCPSEAALYNRARQFQWTQLFSLQQTFAIDANVSGSRITHSKFAALRLKDAIADYFRDQQGKRPNVDPGQPDIRLNLNISQNQALISLDTSGESLHRRGYRLHSVTAPMQETLAAAIIRLSGWNGQKPLLDPFCGSGTLLAEALLKYSRIPPGFKRKRYGFFCMPDFDARAWQQVKRESERDIRECPGGLISGSDSDADAVEAARRNLDILPGGDRIDIKKTDFRSIVPQQGCVIITNPPYGIRIGGKPKGKRGLVSPPELQTHLFRQLGDFLKQKCAGTTAYILCGDKELTRHIGLKISRRIPLFNGPLDSRLVKLDIYSE